MIELEIPYAVSTDALKEVIASWYRAQAHRQASSPIAVARTTKYGAKTIQRQTGFLVQLGVLKPPGPEEGNYYSLTKSGESLGRSADYRQDDRFAASMRFLILAWTQFKPILEYISQTPVVRKEGLLDRILMVSKKPSTDKNAKMGARTLIDLLEEVGLIEYSGERITLTKRARLPPDETIQEHEGDVQSSEKTERQPEEVAKQPDFTVQFSSIGISNIRSVVDLRIPLKKLNILIGSNASGKSSIVHSLLALRNLKWGRTFADSSYRSMEWLRRVGNENPMVVILDANVITENESFETRLLIAFTPVLSYCTQVCVTVDKSWLCDTSFFSKQMDLSIPFDLMRGFGDMKAFSERTREGVKSLSRSAAPSHSASRGEKQVFRPPSSEIAFSVIEDNEGNHVETYLTRGLLGDWPDKLPEFMNSSSKGSLKQSYQAAVSALASTIDSIEFVPVMRGFLSLDYSQDDSASLRLSDDVNFVGQLLNKLILPDELDPQAMDRMVRWAKEYGIDGFESVLRRGRRIEARGKILGGRNKLPLALYGFGSNQFLSLVGKASFALPGSPIIIEEPEIHLHPELQARSADFLIEMMEAGHQLFVTTHSEHLIGRIQRRIAEKRVRPEDVSILWVRHDSDEQGSTVQEVLVDEYGVLPDGIRTFLDFEKAEIGEIHRARMEGRP